MTAQEMLDAKLSKLAGRPVKLLIIELKQMKASDGGIHGFRFNLLPGVIEGVDNTRVPAAGQKNEPFSKRLVSMQVPVPSK